ncbi:MAG: alpha/beta hydrolase family protein [Dehalococcoidia bacterium]
MTMPELQRREVAGLEEVRFQLEVDGEDVPALFYLGDGDGPRPLVIIQHPATSSKDDYFVADVARMWARNGWVVGGLDAPMHGERRAFDPMGMLREPGRFAAASGRFTNELRAVVDFLAGEFAVDLSRLGYVGYSMGSMLGIPAVAGDGRYKAAAFCLVGEGGLVGAASEPGSPVQQLGGVAVRIVGKLQDEFFPKAATEGLHAAMPGEKDLVWLPGGHFEIGQDVITAAGQWMERHIGHPRPGPRRA